MGNFVLGVRVLVPFYAFLHKIPKDTQSLKKYFYGHHYRITEKNATFQNLPLWAIVH